MEDGLQRKQREVSLSQRSFYSGRRLVRETGVDAGRCRSPNGNRWIKHPILQTRMLDQTRAK